MSNKVVPSVYRSIIDQVMANCRNDFDEMGIEDAVRGELQRSWESKVANSRTADYSSEERFQQWTSPSSSALETTSGFGVGNGGPLKDDKDGILPQPASSQGNGKLNGTPLRDPKKNLDDEEIGSDLDEPDDDEIEDNDGYVGDMAIALYDKVQRVKNKWKITLKDGVVNVKGKDYIFSKCSGEFEW
ncbi:TFIIA-domain-containing protein [Atractiella rhizophila]|nr:TFIIA-domain-containing protein [Atractiella rhizophila]